MKNIKIVIINFCFLFIAIILLEIICYFKDTNDFNPRPKFFIKKNEYTIDYLKSNMRKPHGLDYKKKPILIYGCSYAYGFALKEEETFGYKLSKLSKRPVYNFAISSKGLQDTLYLLKNDKKITPEPEYIFYVFINDHVRRMFVNCNKLDYTKYLTYKEKKGILIENRVNIGENSYLIRNIKNESYYILKNIFKKQIYGLMELYFLSIKKEINNKYPNTKFIVIYYENGKGNKILASKIKELEKSGIEIININKEFENKLKKSEYRNDIKKDKFRHPNEKAWDIVVKYLIERYKI